jgi:hypothetical protein
VVRVGEPVYVSHSRRRQLRTADAGSRLRAAARGGALQLRSAEDRLAPGRVQLRG